MYTPSIPSLEEKSKFASENASVCLQAAEDLDTATTCDISLADGLPGANLRISKVQALLLQRQNPQKAAIIDCLATWQSRGHGTASNVTMTLRQMGKKWHRRNGRICRYAWLVGKTPITGHFTTIISWNIPVVSPPFCCINVSSRQAQIHWWCCSWKREVPWQKEVFGMHPVASDLEDVFFCLKDVENTTITWDVPPPSSIQ